MSYKIVLPQLFVLFHLIICKSPKDIDVKPDFSNIDQQEDINFCTGGQNYSNASEQFDAFQQSPCAPLITVTGIMSSKMQVFIYDCDLLPDDVLEHCNIMTDKNKDRFIWKPSFDYIKCKSNQTDFLYPAFDPFDPASLEFGGQCFDIIAGAYLSSLSSYNSSNFPYEIPDLPGIKVTWYGNTPGTFKDSNCGLSDIQNFGLVNFGELVYYGFMSDYVMDMGYQVGLSYFPLPYDWRRMSGNTELQLHLQRTLEYAYNLTGKKAVIVAHSYGVMGIHESLLQIDQATKDKYVERFISICGPFAGAAKMAGNLIMGERESYGPFGYSMKDLRSPFTSLSAIYDLMPKSLFDTEKNQQWAQALLNRIDKEKAWKAGTPVNFSWFPTPDQNCYSFRGNDQDCGFHFYNYFDNPLYVTEGELPSAQYYCNNDAYSYIGEKFGIRTRQELDFIKFMQQTNLTEQEKEAIWGKKELIPKDRIDIMLNMTNRNQLSKGNNLNVPVTAIFSGYYPTDGFFKIYKNPRNVTNQGNSNFTGYVDTMTTLGDDLVALDLALAPLLKWAWEFDNGINNTYPMEVVDYCSEFETILTKNSEGLYTMNYSAPDQNVYHGMPCRGKIHSDILVDEYLIKLVASVVKAGKKPEAVPQKLPDEILQKLIGSCPHLYAPYYTQTVEELFEYGTDESHIYPNKTDFYMEFSQPTQEFIEFLKQLYSKLDNNQEELFKQKQS